MVGLQELVLQTRAVVIHVLYVAALSLFAVTGSIASQTQYTVITNTIQFAVGGWVRSTYSLLHCN